MDQRLQIVELVRGLLGRSPDDRHDTGQDFEVLWLTAVFGHTALEVRVESLRLLKRALGGENDIRSLGGEVHSSIGRTRLHDDRISLHRTRYIQRAAHPKPAALVIE